MIDGEGIMDEVMEQRTILHLEFEIERLERELQHKNEVISQQADTICELQFADRQSGIQIAGDTDLDLGWSA